MGKKTQLIIDADVCDLSDLPVAILEQYEQITIRAAVILVTRRTRELAVSYGMVLNGKCMMEIDEDARLVVKNGSCELNGHVQADCRDVLLVNGKLHIGKDGDEAVRQFKQIAVNGQLVYPESLAGVAGGIMVNGTEQSYPDDAVFMNGDVKLDRLFAVRAVEAAVYYIHGSVWLLEPVADMEKLMEKQIQIRCRKAYVAESLLEQAALLFDQEVPLDILPDGCRILPDESLLTEANAGYIGARIYADRDLYLTEDNVKALQCVEKLIVNGTVSIPETVKRIAPLVKLVCDGVIFTKTMVISERPSVELVISMLEMSPGGLEIRGCVSVYIQPDVPPKLIKERLRVRDCQGVFCSKAQLGGVEAVCANVLKISTAWDRGEEAEGAVCHVQAEVYKL